MILTSAILISFIIVIHLIIKNFQLATKKYTIIYLNPAYSFYHPGNSYMH